MSIYIKDPGSALTHFIGIIMAVAATPFILNKAFTSPDKLNIISQSIFMVSLIMLYTASTVYHSLNKSVKVNLILRKLDHIMIFFLIAGSYTPICLVVLKGEIGLLLFTIIWTIAAFGTVIKIFWINCPKWFSSVLYIAMGWVCILAIRPIMAALPAAAIGWLFAGGVIYTLGGIIYALKGKQFNEKHPNFGTHEIFHLFVLAGSLCHFIMMYSYIACL